MNGSIYIIKNTINDKVYIGQTIQTVEARFKRHLCNDPRKRNQAISWAMEKHGRENFYVETLVTGITDPAELDALEEKYIAEYQSMRPNGYNLCPGGQKWRNSKLAATKVDRSLVDDYLSGMPLRAVAEKHGCSVSKVKNHVLRAGENLRPAHNEFNPRASELDEFTLRRLFIEEGKTDTEISALTGLSARWVRKRRQMFNIHRI